MLRLFSKGLNVRYVDALQVLSQWLADKALLPIESSAHGSIHTVYDLLIRSALLCLPAVLSCSMFL